MRGPGQPLHADPEYLASRLGDHQTTPKRTVIIVGAQSEAALLNPAIYVQSLCTRSVPLRTTTAL